MPKTPKPRNVLAELDKLVRLAKQEAKKYSGERDEEAIAAPRAFVLENVGEIATAWKLDEARLRTSAETDSKDDEPRFVRRLAFTIAGRREKAREAKTEDATGRLLAVVAAGRWEGPTGNHCAFDTPALFRALEGAPLRAAIGFGGHSQAKDRGHPSFFPVSKLAHFASLKRSSTAVHFDAHTDQLVIEWRTTAGTRGHLRFRALSRHEGTIDHMPIVVALPAKPGEPVNVVTPKFIEAEPEMTL